MKRNANIECYRCFLMFGICLIHVIGYYGTEWHWLSSALMWCVPGFVFITGYYGCKFSLMRVVRIYGVAIWCFFVSSFIFSLFGGGGGKGVCYTFLNNWFIHAYIILMMVAPIIDAAITSLGKEINITDSFKVFGPFLVLIFMWSFLAGFNITRPIVPRSPGLVAYSGWTLLGVYIAARIFRVTRLDERVTTKMAGLLFVVSIAISMLKIGQYNSPVALVAAASCFVLFHRFHLTGLGGKVVLFISPSMFPIFLMHANGFVFEHIKEWDDFINGYVRFLPVSFLIIALMFFIVGLLLDLPRRLLLGYFKGK